MLRMGSICLDFFNAIFAGQQAPALFNPGV
jgi:hypothetical protein